MLTLSLIIPAYNEERHIKACLDAVASQTRMPDEVIVVDNNCTDNTIDIAASYKFVRIIKEKKQGRGYARSAGFNAANSQLIGRIDADARIDPRWVEIATAHFANDPELSGATGLGRSSFFPGIKSFRTTLPSRMYYWFVHGGFKTITMWGANMVIRSDAWTDVKDDVCLNDSMAHEDQDISLWMASKGYNIKQINELKVTIDGQSYRYLPKTVQYTLLYLKTKRMHRENGNLDSPKVHKLSFRRVLPGRLFIIVPTVVLFFIALLLLPLDFIIMRLRPNSPWLE